MNLRHLTDEQLLKDTRALVEKEQAVLTDLLWHFYEVDSRKLYSPHKDIYEYVKKEHRYPDDQAYRRIKAMRVLAAVPEVEDQIRDGSLNITNLCLAQKHFENERQEIGRKLTREEKFETLNAIAGQSTRAAERFLVEQSSAPEKMANIESVRPLAGDQNKVTLQLNDECLEKIEILKGLLAHKLPMASRGEILEQALDLAIDTIRHSKTKETKRSASAAPRSESGLEMPTQKTKSEKKRVATASLKREVWRRAGSRCEKCGSHYKLEIDHRKPFALGGLTTIENLRLLCFNCNQRQRVMSFGG